MTMGRNLGMTDAQIEWVKSSLQRGWFVAAFAEGDWHEPFAFESKYVNLAHNVTEADVLESQRPLEALPVIPDDDFRNWERHPVAELQPDSAGPALSPGETRFFNAVAADPGKPAGHYTRKLAMNGKVARAARERLVQLGLVREDKVQLAKRGKPSIVLSPLPAARAATTAASEAI